MTDTSILGITLLADGQIDQYLTQNEATVALEEAGNDFVSVDLSAGNATLSAAQFAADFLFRSSGNSVPRSITIPAKKRFFVVENGGSDTLSVIRGGTGINIDAGDAGAFYSDGTTDGLRAIASGGGGGGGPSVDSYDTASIASGAIDLSDEDIAVWLVSLTANITSITLPTALPGQALSVVVIFVQDGTGGRTVTGWPTTIWESGSAPTIASGAGSVTSVPLLILGNGDVYGVS